MVEIKHVRDGKRCHWARRRDVGREDHPDDHQWHAWREQLQFNGVRQHYVLLVRVRKSRGVQKRPPPRRGFCRFPGRHDR
ncbi:protein of unknown function [Cupriavidus taiwanensis]|nr:protein of unknown function [Cupriavidus taiwanensis]